jgi:alpha-1,2-mannosyltransferase
MVPEDADPGSCPPRPGASRGEGWGVLVTTAVLAVIAALSFRHGQDLTVFWRAGARLVAGEPLYPPGDGFLAFRYAPGTALLFAPLALLPLPAAKVLWYALLVACGAAAVRLVTPSRDARPVVTALLVLLAVARPLVEELACAQVNLPVLVLLLLAFRAEDGRRPHVAGLLVALAIGLKLAPAVFLVELALRRRRRALAAAAAGMALLAAAPLPWYGLSGTLALHADWVRSLASAAPGTSAAPGNQSLFGLAARLGLPAVAAELGAVAVIAFALAQRAAERRRSLLLFATALASPMGWIQNFVCAMPAAASVVRAGPRRAAAAAALGALLLVPLYDVSGPRFEQWFFARSLPLAALAALFALAATSPGRAAGD